MVRAVLVDPFEKTVTEIENDGQLDAIKEAIGLTGENDRPIDTYGILGGEAAVFIDDEGLYQPEQRYWLLAPGLPPFAGKGVIYGLDRMGGCIDHPFIMDKIRAGVTFPDISFAGADTSEQNVNHPVFGPMRQIKSEAIFRDNATGKHWVPIAYEEPEGFADDNLPPGGDGFTEDKDDAI